MRALRWVAPLVLVLSLGCAATAPPPVPEPHRFGAQMIVNIQRSVASINGQTVNQIVDTQGVANISFHVVMTGTPTGTFAWKRCNASDCDPSAKGTASTNWSTFSPSGAPANPAGAASNTVFELNPGATRYYLATYTDSGGGSAGTLLFAIFGKGNG